MKRNPGDLAAREAFERNKADLGYALLLKRFVADPRTANSVTIDKAAWSTVPNVPALFWMFRAMAGLGFGFIAFFTIAFVLLSRRQFDQRWFLRMAVIVIPLPWVAIEIGWIVAEIGRQPWAVDGVLPTFLGTSSLTAPQIWTTIIGFTLLYGVLAFIEVRLMLATIGKGPEPYMPWLPRRDPVPDPRCAPRRRRRFTPSRPNNRRQERRQCPSRSTMKPCASSGGRCWVSC